MDVNTEVGTEAGNAGQSPQAAPAETGAKVSGRRAWRRLVASLFPEPGLAPATRRRVLFAVVSLLAGAALSLSRTRGPGALDSTWIEDGKRFLTGALNNPFPGPIFEGFNGYFHVGPRILAEIAVLFPIRWTAPVLTLLAVAMLLAFASVAYIASGAFLNRWWLRLLVAAPVMAIPVGHTQADNDVATLQFPSLYALFWLLLWRPRSRVAKAAAVLLAAYVMSSSILALALLPLLLLRLVGVRDWTTKAIALSYTAGAALQIGGLISGANQREGIGEPNYNPIWVLREYVVRAVPRSILGEVWLGGPGTDDGGNVVPLHVVHTTEHYALIAIAWLILAGALACALLNITRPHWPLAVLAGVASLVVFGVETANMGMVEPRYVIPAALLLYVAVAALLRPHDTTRLVDSARPAIAFAVLLAVVCVANLRVDDTRSRSQAWSVTVAKGRHACATTGIQKYHYQYTWWFVDIPCSRLR